jgi:hypothetical protein
MTWHRRLAAGVVVAGLGALSSAARAEDPAPKPAEPAAPAETVKKAEPPKKKDPFFGDRFAMYLETRGGPSSIKSLSNPVTSNTDSSSQNEVSFNTGTTGEFTIGWTLPRDRGQYLLTYTGVADGTYDVKATGYQRSYIQEGGGAVQVPTSELPWWSLNINDGQLQTTKTPPRWNIATDDTNHNGFPDQGEFRYGAPTVDVGATVPKDLGNQLQTWDLLYRRGFGGAKIHARWTAGVRYLTYEGAVPCPAWLTGTIGISGFGYSDGVSNKMILMQQNTSGWGPTGSGEVDFNFFRQRLTLYGKVQAAFLQEKLDGDSGAFTFLAFQNVSGGGIVIVPGSGRIQQSETKSSWNTTLEIGARVKLLEGFNLIVDWNTTGYLDTVLLPETISVPANAAQTALGTVATYVSRDIVTSSITLGLSYQF